MKERFLIGRFLDTGSWVHGIDPRAKVTGMFIYMATIFLTRSLFDLAIMAVFSFVLMVSSRIPLLRFLRTLQPLLFILVFILAFHALFESGGMRLVEVGPVQIYAGGLERGVTAAVRMALFVMFAGLLTFTTSPPKLTRALEDILYPLRWLGLSPERMSLMIGIALRFLPTVFEEAEKILKAQASRGMDFAELPLRKKARQLLALLVPVTTGAFRRAVELADSMESRGYRIGSPRTKYETLEWQLRDSAFVGIFFVLLIGIIAG